MGIEVLYQRIPFVEDILRSEPSEVIAVSYDKCVKEMGYLNTPWDLKLFYKWINGKPLFVCSIQLGHPFLVLGVS